MTDGLFHVSMINTGFRYCVHRIARTLVPGVLFIAIAACRNDPEQIRALTGRSNRQEDRAEDVTLIYSKDGKVKMRAFAHDFVRNENANQPYIDMNTRLKAEFFDDSGVIEHTLTADSSRYYTAKGDIIVWDSVQVVSKKGDQQLNTTEMIWNESIQKFFTEKPVRITSATEILYGDGLEANSDFSWYKIINPKGTVSVSKGEVPK
jgi:LPS export ABC transporter protein LptC